ncbi:MAG: RNA methyltransferase [Bacteroidota bacterium]
MQKVVPRELSPDAFRTHAKFPLAMVLDNVRSMHNVGAAFRIADAFLVEKVYLCGITAKPPHRDIYKTALGAEAHVAWEYTQDTLVVVQRLKANGYTVAAVEQATHSVPLQAFTMQTGYKCAVIFGHEVFGVQDSVLAACDLCLEIPQRGVKHSLNVSVAMGIVLWTLSIAQDKVFAS